MSPDWPTVRAQIVHAFDGELPGAHLETALVDLYENNPSAVVNSIQSVATSLKNGKINSGWAVLKTAAAKKATQQTNPTVSREKLIRNADQWLRNAGIHYNRWDEVHDELFGSRGMLHPWADQPKLVDRMREAWEQARPVGEQLDREELERAEHWKANKAKLAAMPKHPKPEPKVAA